MATEVRLPVDHVSDTAFLVAMYRSYESERPDARFKDPYAALLAAPKAKKLESAIPFREEGRWFMTVRTCLLDRHILQQVAEGVDTVVNLATGLDTRPYRLDLPKHVRWIEADFPGIIEYKSERLSAQTPRCRLERIALDLTDEIARRQLFSYIDRDAKRTLVITEGLLPYLTDEAVTDLAHALHELPSVTHWLMDVTAPDFLKVFKDRWKVDAKAAGSEVALRFAPPEGHRYFEKLGWNEVVFDSFLDGSHKLNFPAPASLQLEGGKAGAADDSGIALLAKR